MESNMKCNVSEMFCPKMPKGMDYEISHHPLTMKHVVNLIVAMERFKGHSHSESLMSTEFRDEDLLNIMLESIVEEEILFERGSAPEPKISWTGEQLCSMTDGEKRSLVQVQSSMELHAVTLQGGAQPRKVLLNMSTYLHPAPSVMGRTVALGIKGTDLYLSCRKDGAEPTLHLETLANKSLLTGLGTRIGLDSDLVRFLFYRQDTGVNITTLMSVAQPNWYISTAQQDNRPLAMCLESTQHSRIFSIREEVERQG
ncbi:interleukin-1 beta-like [Anoplopoma fimbria]|uniref:interleukin-1 beta-like n=1 Tax=Anoplopoma fimbria TaxID=229290 RepID=UPI0023EDEDB1|nr:interleukin-1 beta-like [Anoplopoma fimbria]XP_054466426.1 interleukin-1 beta-like [Anoplopoma fimbria]XP_054483094.1 interleukin-1 beta-like [Anoplopoma fimbria]